jgi:hypothetical protein
MRRDSHAIILSYVQGVNNPMPQRKSKTLLQVPRKVSFVLNLANTSRLETPKSMFWCSDQSLSI